MNAVTAVLHKLFVGRRPLLRWGLGLLIAAAIVLFLWIGRDSDPGATALSPPTPSAATDIVPPMEHEGAAAPLPESTGESGGDIIPPEEP